MRGALIYSALLVLGTLTGCAIARLPAWTDALARLILLLARSMP